MDSSVNLSPLFKGKDTDFVLCYFSCDVVIVGLNVLMSCSIKLDFLFSIIIVLLTLKDISYSIIMNRKYLSMMFSSFYKDNNNIEKRKSI